MNSSADDNNIGKHILSAVKTVATAVPNSAAESLIRRARAQHPNRNPGEVLRALDNMYVSGLTVAGAGVGAVAAMPVVGTSVAVGANIAETILNIESTLTYALAYARIHSIEISDVERRTTLLLAVLLGDSALGAISTMTERTGVHWARQILTRIPAKQLRHLNRILGRHFVTKYGTTKGIIVLGRELPLLIGAGLGAGANFIVARLVVKSVHRAFGPAPAAWI